MTSENKTNLHDISIYFQDTERAKCLFQMQFPMDNQIWNFEVFILILFIAFSLNLKFKNLFIYI